MEFKTTFSISSLKLRRILLVCGRYKYIHLHTKWCVCVHTFVNVRENKKNFSYVCFFHQFFPGFPCLRMTSFQRNIWANIIVIVWLFFQTQWILSFTSSSSSSSSSSACCPPSTDSQNVLLPSVPILRHLGNSSRQHSVNTQNWWI